jgi:type I restriction enzyme, R subunit
MMMGVAWPFGLTAGGSASSCPAIPVGATGAGRKPEPELDRLSNILKTFNDQFGNIPWTDADRVHNLITEDIPARVAADTAYQNAQKNSDKQNACIEHDKAPAWVMTAVLKDDTELFKQSMDNESFRRWLTDTVFGLTYETALSPCKSDNTIP